MSISLYLTLYIFSLYLENVDFEINFNDIDISFDHATIYWTTISSMCHSYPLLRNVKLWYYKYQPNFLGLSQIFHIQDLVFIAFFDPIIMTLWCHRCTYNNSRYVHFRLHASAKTYGTRWKFISIFIIGDNGTGHLRQHIINWTRMWNMISSPATPTVCLEQKTENSRSRNVTLSMPSQSKKSLYLR